MSRAQNFGGELAGAMPEPSPMAPDMVREFEAESAAADGANGAGVQQLETPPVDPGVAAVDTADLIFTLAAGTLGPEWEPSPDERSRCVRALERYYRRYGSFDLPPGLALVAAFAMYAFPRARGQLGSIMGMLSGVANAPAGGPENPQNENAGGDAGGPPIDVLHPGDPFREGLKQNAA